MLSKYICVVKIYFRHYHIRSKLWSCACARYTRECNEIIFTRAPRTTSLVVCVVVLSYTTRSISYIKYSSRKNTFHSFKNIYMYNTHTYYCAYRLNRAKKLFALLCAERKFTKEIKNSHHVLLRFLIDHRDISAFDDVIPSQWRIETRHFHLFRSLMTITPMGQRHVNNLAQTRM